MDYYQEGLPYYGDGGRAKYLKFLLNIARPELFHEITGLERETFNRLVAEIREANLLVDGRSVTVEEQLLIFLDIVRYNNSMRQTSVKFRRGLYTTNRSVIFFYLNSFIKFSDGIPSYQVLWRGTGGIISPISSLCQI